MEDVIKLISTNPAQQADGTWSNTPAGRDVLCNVMTISRAEYFGAERAGHSPAYRFDIHAAEYNGETVAEYRGETYAIYRSYQDNGNSYVGANLRARQELRVDIVELYAERKSGAVGMTVSDVGGPLPTPPSP